MLPAPGGRQVKHAAVPALVVLLLYSWSEPSLAQGADKPGPPSPAEQTQPAAPGRGGGPLPGQTGAGTPPPAPSPEAPKGLFERDTLLGDMGGVRTALGRYGVSLGLSETSEVFGNPTGGINRGVIYEGLTQVSLGIDLDKAIGVAGGIINISAFQIHGRGLSINNVNNLNVTSGIEADRATRLFEWWYQQSLFGGKADIKLGQQSADVEFMTSQYSGLFVNASFGWPTLPAVDLPSGGPAYPLATPGVRLRVTPNEQFAALFAVFNGSPAGLRDGDPQRLDASGTNFDLDSGVFVISEVQYALNSGDKATGLPGTYKLGVWYNSNASDNQFFSNGPINASDPIPRRLRHNYSIYAVADQLVYRPPGAKDGGAGVFLRAMGAPGDRNLVNVFVSGGVTYKGGFGRDNDTVGLGVSWARISDTVRAGDAAFAQATGAFIPTRTSETVLELSYQTQIAPWWAVQPDLQYVFNPAGGIPNPNRPGKRIGDTLIMGMRTGVTF
jgi:porin